MWSGKKKKGSAEEFFRDEELDQESGGRKLKEKEDKEKRKKEKEKHHTESGVGLFQRKHKKATGSADIEQARRDKEKDAAAAKEKGGGRFHRRNRSSSSDPTAADVVATAASKLNVPPSPSERDLRLSIKRETFSPPGTLNMGLLSSYPPPNVSPRKNGEGAEGAGASSGVQSGPVTPLPQLADLSHKRKSSVDETSPRFSDPKMQPIPISELLHRSPITSPRSPSLGKELTEQQRQILLQAKKKLHLELVRDLDLVPERPKPKEELRRMLEEWGDDSEMENQRIQADQEKYEQWKRAHEALTIKTGDKPFTSALGQYLHDRWNAKRQTP